MYEFVHSPDVLADIREDALPSLDFLLQTLSSCKPGGKTPEGRALRECQWLRQELIQGTLKVPLYKAAGMPELREAVVRGSLDRIHPQVRHHVNVLLVTLHQGKPLLRPKYLPNLQRWIALIELVFQRRPVFPGSPEDRFLSELRRLGELATSGSLPLPVQPGAFPVVDYELGGRRERDGEMSYIGEDRDPDIAEKLWEIQSAIHRGVACAPPPPFEGPA